MKPAAAARLLTPAEAAAQLGVGVRNVQRWCANGHIKAVKVGASWGIPPESLNGFEPPKEGWPKGRRRKKS